MSDSNNLGDGSSPGGRRRSIVELLAPRSTGNSSLSSSPGSGATNTTPQPVPNHRRGMSIASLGLNNSAPGQTSPFNAFAKQRRASISTSSASGSPEFRNSFDDGAVIEEDDASRPSLNSPPSPSFARRLSFGAQALRDVRQGGGPPVNGGGEGFNWSDNMRDKTKRSPSMTGSNPFAGSLNRARSTSSNNPDPPKEMPRPTPAPAPSKMKKPDHLGERMLRGDFMMD